MSLYRDLSADADARTKLDEVTPLTAVLEALRFTRLGLLASGKSGQVAEVWRSPDQDAFAEPEWHPGRRPHLAFRTLFPDGTVLQTSEPRRGALRFAPLWVRQHHPKAGYLLEEVDAPPHQVYLRHRERVEEAKAEHGAPPPHASFPIYSALGARSLRITRARTRVAQVAGIALFLPAALWATFAQGAPRWLPPVTPLWWALATWGTFQVALRLPLPKPRPLGTLKGDPGT